MALGVTEEHAALADSVRGWAERAGLRAATRVVIDATAEERPAAWSGYADQGLLGLHLAEEHGGSGASAVELAVVQEELARALAPGPFTATVLASLVIAASGAPVAKELLPALADGSRTAAVALGAGTLVAAPNGDGITLTGATPATLSAHLADVLVVAAAQGDDVIWIAVDGSAARLAVGPGLDPGRRSAIATFADVTVPADRVLAGLTVERVRDLAAVVLAAEASGIAGWCLDTAAAYAKVREQFGAPIGSFQAVKHLCADMLVRSEEAAAVAWDAARTVDEPDQSPLTAAVAATIAIDAAVFNAKTCIQVLGGIGFTWEHDAHLYLKRALALRALLGGQDAWGVRCADLSIAGARRVLDLDLSDAEDVVASARALAQEIAALPVDQRRARLADEGLITPHWPAPWGRGASPIEQIVLDTELRAAGVVVPDLVIGAWALPTIVQYGTEEQKERFVRPTLHGELVWCQLFSEPGAGSDLASLQMKAEKVDGGWKLNGQKVWNSVADRAHFGICLARTGHEGQPKHKGITYFLIDMKSPGVEVRPLREITGEALFNEVFFTDVFVPDELVVGEINGGWNLARTTLANERVAMSGRNTLGPLLESVIERLAADGGGDLLDRRRVGLLVAEELALAVLGFRTTLARVSGTDPGAAGSVQKLAGMRHRQDVAETATELLPEDVLQKGIDLDAPRETSAVRAFFQDRCLTIAGGTTEVLKNLTAERVLGLPRG
ncbi:MAG TPA: acyl-CoA dehydrogenase [Mycobacteriales bacterium]|nr:acyl-CoA dehydrogenase [Mycobacteriales bacterium]